MTKTIYTVEMTEEELRAFVLLMGYCAGDTPLSQLDRDITDTIGEPDKPGGLTFEVYEGDNGYYEEDKMDESFSEVTIIWSENWEDAWDSHPQRRMVKRNLR